MLEPAATVGGADQRSEGFTLLETAVVSAVLLIVLAIAGSVLISMQKVSNATEAKVASEQFASTELQSIAGDVRSAHSLSIPNGSAAGDAIQLTLNNPSGGTPTTVEWLYNTSSSTLMREVIGSDGSIVSTGTITHHVANGSSNPVFTFYNDQGQDVSTSSAAYIGACSTAVGIDVMVASSEPGVPVFNKSEVVTITDQQQILSAPGNGQC